MAEEEREHRDWLYGLYRTKFGEHLPPIRREDVRGFLKRQRVLVEPNLDLDRMRREAELMELQAANFYDRAAEQTTDVSVRELFVHLAEVERGHETQGRRSSPRRISPPTPRQPKRSAQQRLFVLQYVQPGLAGLIDGSVSTLAPLFAAAFATHSNWETFLVGLAASIGAGISMGFTEALSDDGQITGRGSPVLRGIVCGAHDRGRRHRPHPALPRAGRLAERLRRSPPRSPPSSSRWSSSRSPGSAPATWTRPFLRAAFQVILGGVLVLLAGILIGSA